MANQWNFLEINLFDLGPSGTTTVDTVNNRGLSREGWELFGLRTYASINAGNYTLLLQMRGNAAYGATGQSYVWKEALNSAGNPLMQINGSGVTDELRMVGTSSGHPPFIVLPEETRFRLTAATPTSTDVAQIVGFFAKPFGG